MLLRKVSSWLHPHGLLFVHIFVNRSTPYHFVVRPVHMVQRVHRSASNRKTTAGWLRTSSLAGQCLLTTSLYAFPIHPFKECSLTSSLMADSYTSNPTSPSNAAGILTARITAGRANTGSSSKTRTRRVCLWVSACIVENRLTSTSAFVQTAFVISVQTRLQKALTPLRRRRLFIGSGYSTWRARSCSTSTREKSAFIPPGSTIRERR